VALGVEHVAPAAGAAVHKVGAVVEQEVEVLEGLGQKERIHVVLQLARLHVHHARIPARLTTAPTRDSATRHDTTRTTRHDTHGTHGTHDDTAHRAHEGYHAGAVLKGGEDALAKVEPDGIPGGLVQVVQALYQLRAQGITTARRADRKFESRT
jgi:hypothetical protein